MYAKNTWEKYKDQLNEVFDYNEGYPPPPFFF